MVPCGVGAGAPATAWGGGALEGVVAKALAVGALRSGAEAKASLQAVGGGEGREAGELSKLLCLGASDGDDDGGGRLPCPLGLWGKPPGLVCESQPSVVGGELPADIGKGVRGGDAMHNNLCRGRVQLDSECAGD